ncbi:MAG: NAD(P)H-binding protein [Armatimonadetes bacterium]|nr:NAD(P)H-binding protein [Armatimonadota bacterium]
MILVTGAAGFIGSHLIPHLRAADLPVRAMVRPGSPKQYLARQGVEVVEGDVTRPLSLLPALRGVETVIHLVGLIREPPGVTFEAVVAEGTRSLLRAAEEAGVRRFVYVSGIGARLDALSRYARTKAIAEGIIRRGACDYVIVRPSVVYGPGDELVELFRNWPVPLPGDGKVHIQPILVDQLVEILRQCAERGDLANQTFEVGGPTPITYNEMARTINRVSGRRLPHPHVPLSLMEAQAWFLEMLKKPLHSLGLSIPLTRDQALMMTVDNFCEVNHIEHTFGLELISFEDGLRSYLKPAAA